MEHNCLASPPVRVYQTDDLVMVVAPLPGVEPEDIEVSITEDRVTVSATERGHGQHRRDVVVAEWTIGGYRRELRLPQPVSGKLTDATYGNGVLVLAMPRAVGKVGTDVTFRLQPVHARTRGEHVGHTGSSIEPTTTEEHLRMQGPAIR